MNMTIRERLQIAYMKRLASSAEGRGFILRQLADAESNGESQIFERLLSKVDDPKLKQLIEKHQADEVRHAELYTRAAERQGVAKKPAPDHLKIIDRLDRAVGGFLSKPIETDRDVMEAYVMLQVIEERGITQFKLLEQAFRPYDPQSADVIAEIAGDEERHLKYCLAISRRYAPDEATRLTTLVKYRELEAKCFAENSEAMSAFTMEKGYFTGGPLARWFFSTLQGLGARQGLPYTNYAEAA
jgi:rubrerythrin